MSEQASTSTSTPLSTVLVVEADIMIWGPCGPAHPDSQGAWPQIRYLLGDSGESFMVGFGPKSPLRPTHGAASCAGNYTVRTLLAHLLTCFKHFTCILHPVLCMHVQHTCHTFCLKVGAEPQVNQLQFHAD